MDIIEYTLKQVILTGWIAPQRHHQTNPSNKKFDLFAGLRQWIDLIQVDDPRLSHFLCKLIPAQCPFARQIKLFGRTVLTIPPLCKINPLYDELMMLRFRAISYLAEECGEDVSSYC